MTAPRWIAEALDAACDAARHILSDVRKDAIASALIERLPIEAMTGAIRKRTAGTAGITGDWISAVSGLATAGAVYALTDGDPEVVELTEFYQGACKALDSAGVPYAVDVEVQPHLVIESTIGELEPRKSVEVDHVPAHHAQIQLDLAGRIRWLAQQRPTRLDLQRVEDERESFRADAMHVRAIVDVIGLRDAAIKSLTFEREHFKQMAGDLQMAINDMSEVVRRLETERDLARAMHQDAERAFADAKRGDR